MCQGSLLLSSGSYSHQKVKNACQFCLSYLICNNLFSWFGQSSVCLKQLAYDLIELLLSSAFPELEYVFKEVHEEKHKFGEFKAQQWLEHSSSFQTKYKHGSALYDNMILLSAQFILKAVLYDHLYRPLKNQFILV